MGTSIERFLPWVERLMEIDDPRSRASFLEVINHRTNEGCVVRALESAFGVEATDEEWDMRVEDLKKLREEFKQIEEIDDPRLRLEVSLTKRVADRKMVKTYLTKVAEHETPLGHALRRSNLIDTALDQKQIRRIAESGGIVLIDVIRGKARHLAHIGIKGGEIVSLNDDGEKVDLGGRNNKFAALVFTPLK